MSMSLSVSGKSNSALISSLKAVHEQLSKMSQESTDKSTLSELISQLPPLLGHKERAVKSYLAVILADILRLYAPEPPFADDVLNKVLALFVKELGYICSVDNPFYNLEYYLLDSLSTVRSVVLLIDSADDSLFVTLFDSIFTSIHTNVPDPTKLLLLDIASQLINECESIPYHIIDLLMTHFEKRSTYPISGQLASGIIQQCTDKLQPYISQYFSDSISATTTDLEERKRSVHLIYELALTSPDSVINILPYLEQQLLSTVLETRALSTLYLGKIMSEKDSQCIKMYPQIFNSWLARSTDKNASIRVIVIEQIFNIFSNHPTAAHQANLILSERIIDPDDKVRFTVVKLVNPLDPISMSHLSKDFVKQLQLRCLDSKLAVRQEAMSACLCLLKNGLNRTEGLASHLMGLMYSSCNTAARNILPWIEQSFLTFSTGGTAEVNQLNFGSSKTNSRYSEEQAEYLIDLFSDLSEKSLNAWKNLIKRKLTTIQILNRIQQALQDQQELPWGKLAVSLSELLGCEVKEKELHTLCMQLEKDDYHFKLVAVISDPAVAKDKRLSAGKKLQAAYAASGFIENLTVMISWMWIDTSIASSLMSMDSGKLLVQALSSDLPNIFTHRVDSIRNEIIKCSTPSEAGDLLREMHVATRSKKQSALPTDQIFKKKLEALAKKRDTVRYASKLLVSVNSKEQNKTMGENICQTLQEEGKGMSDEEQYCALVTLKNVTKILKIQNVEESLLIQFITSNDNPESDANDVEEWMEDDQLSLKERISLTALSIYVNAEKSASIPLLTSILTSEGEISESFSSPALKMHMILKSAKLLLNLIFQHNSNDVLVDINIFYIIIQYPIFQARKYFSHKLLKLLYGRKIPFRWSSLLYLAAYEPVTDWKSRITHSITHILNTSNQGDSSSITEMNLVVLLEILAQHPDFSSSSKDDIILFAKYIDYFLSFNISKENISFLFEICTQIKKYTLSSELSTRNLFTLSDLTSLKIREIANSNSWPLTSYPFEIEMPNHLKALPQGFQAQNITKNYLPEEMRFGKSSYKKRLSNEGKKPRTKMIKSVAKVESDDNDDDEAEEEEDQMIGEVTVESIVPMTKSAGASKKTMAKARIDIAHESSEEDQEQESESESERETKAKKRSTAAQVKSKITKIDSISGGGMEEEIMEKNSMQVPAAARRSTRLNK